MVKKSQSTFNWYTAEDILANEMFEESPSSSFEQTRPNSLTSNKKHSNLTKNKVKETVKIDWQIVDEILMEEIFEELPILSFDQTRPSLAAFAKRYPNYDEAEPKDIVKAYFRYITRKHIRLANFHKYSESLDKVATVMPMFYVAKSVLDDMGIRFDLTLDRKKMGIRKIAYVGRPESTLPLKKETIIVLKRIGCKLNSKKKNIKFTHTAIINWFNRTISESLTFHKESVEETFQNIIDKTEQRMTNEFIYLID